MYKYQVFAQIVNVHVFYRILAHSKKCEFAVGFNILDSVYRKYLYVILRLVLGFSRICMYSLFW